MAITPIKSWAQEDYLDPHPQDPRTRPSSWQANVFVGSAFLAAVAGIVIICLDKGTSNGATQRLIEKENKHPHHHHHHLPDNLDVTGDIYE
jgi:hypothetical protein